jgi:2-polyprenyl-3-methyl-5-hydroxy-6-metoxy-1,4-benzoquinol methylase
MRRNYKGINISATKNTHEVVLSLIDKDFNAKIVDIPCGNGAFIQRLKDHGYKSIKAMDIRNSLEIEHDDFSVGDMTIELPILNNFCDLFVCIDGIEHISRQFDFVKDVYRVLKDNGEFILSTPNISSIKSRLKWFLTGHHHKYNVPLDEKNPSPSHHIGLISFPEMRYLLHTNGYKINKIKTNRIKPVSWFFLLFIPLIFFSTLWVYAKKGKKYNRVELYKEIFKTMISKDILLGETLIVKAIKR